MSEPNDIIHQSTRLRMMATLNALGAREMLEFSRLKAVLGISDGNMSTHLATLEKAGYIQISKDIVGKKPRTQIALTKEGRRAFQDHVSYLRGLLEA
ncbi:MAG TPA: transcriptional regulator [Steroidobacteraceae bacterium]|jgi:DNA-binding MarR family transcriptional regulator|nr:transcriptional regulator [Steroidobacteraceae bacterium]